MRREIFDPWMALIFGSWDKVLAPIECNRSLLVQYAILSLHAVGKIVQSGASYTGMINEDYGLLDPLMFGS